jgi:fermentation-respiration switch protein FrsA (DUF1100 family)
VFPYDKSSYDGTLHGLKIIKSDNGNDLAIRYLPIKTHKKVALYFHGNYLDIGNLDEIAIQFNQQGYSFLSMDYQGYGLSQGRAREKNTYADSQLLYQQAILMGYKPENIIIVGRSIGTGVATELVVNHKARALVLMSPLTSIYRVITHYPILLFDRFNNLAKINKLTIPLVIVHGSEDKIIPPWHSELLFNKYAGVKHRQLVYGAGHNDLWDYDMSELFKTLNL